MSVANYRLALGRSIRALREEQGISLRKFGAMVGIDYLHLGAVERGEAGLTIDLLVKIAGGLGVKVQDLICF